jgi:hypothetical protein
MNHVPEKLFSWSVPVYEYKIIQSMQSDCSNRTVQDKAYLKIVTMVVCYQINILLRFNTDATI